jgi:hypothetical protein
VTRCIWFDGVEERKRPNTIGAKAKATAEIPSLTERDKRGYAPGVELGLDVAKQGVSMNQHLVLQGMRDAFTELSIQAKNTEASPQGTAAKPQGSF